MNPVLTKADFVRRYMVGEFGNASPTWPNVSEWYASDHWNKPPHNETKLYNLRNWRLGGRCLYDLEPEQIIRYGKTLVREESDGQFYVSAMAPSHATLIQGEVLWDKQYPEMALTYSHVRAPMRDALRESCLTALGLRARLLLRHFLCSNSHAWLFHLFKTYPEHVIEFSVYDRFWGTVPRFNTVFWEVRKY